MWFQRYYWFCMFIFHCGSSQEASSEEATVSSVAAVQLTAKEKKLSETLLEILDHFKKPDPYGIPGADIPDPYPVPDMTKAILFGPTIYFKRTSVFGNSKFRIVNITLDIEALEVQGVLTVDKLQARGDYEIWSLFQSEKGPFTLDGTGVKFNAQAKLGIDESGKLMADNIFIDVTTEKVSANFQNLSALGKVIQGMVNTLSTFIFDSIKPYILKETYMKTRKEIDRKLDEVAGDIQFSNTVPPLDIVLIDCRKKVREMGMDPLFVENYNTSFSIFSADISHTYINGISSFYRVGNVTMAMKNNTVIADFGIGTQELRGSTQWELSTLEKFMTRTGSVVFLVEYIRVRVILAQPLNTRKRPELINLDVELGNIQILSEGSGTLDYVVEFVVNFLPNLLRFQLMDTLEIPIKEIIQQQLDKIDIEQWIREESSNIDEMQDFKLSFLRSTENKEQVYDGDDFFNF